MPALRVDKAAGPMHRHVHEIDIGRVTRQVVHRGLIARFQTIRSLKPSKYPRCD
jgi:hypothetical protein